MRIAVVANTAWYLRNFRQNLMKELQRRGHDVVAVAPWDDYGVQLEEQGIPFRHVAISGMGTNPLRELSTVHALRSVLRREQAELVLSYTPKGNLYSAIACIVDRRPFVPNVSGLGRAFIKESPVTHVVRTMYRFCLRRARRVFFQNAVDRDLFVRQRLVPAGLTELVPGSGVDLQRFSPDPDEGQAVNEGGDPVFLMVSRALWDKGLGEYAAAVRALRTEISKARFQLLGPLWPGNPAAVPRETLDEWVREGTLEYLGATDDVRPFIRESSCVVLPSYREGMPRVLLEAAAMGKPVITTDAPGCRDALLPGKTGFTCRVRDAEDLERVMRQFMGLSCEARVEMGRRGRAFVEEHFDEQVVIDRYLALVEAIESEKGQSRS